MSHLKVKGQSPGVIAVEITPDRDARWFAVVWAGAGFAMLAVFWYQFGAIFFRSPLALLLAAKQLGVDDGDHSLALRVDVAPLAADHYVILARSGWNAPLADDLRAHDEGAIALDSAH